MDCPFKANAASVPPIVKTFDSFKTFWSKKITLINKASIPANLHGYGMMATSDNLSAETYNKSLTNFGAAVMCSDPRVCQITGLHNCNPANPNAGNAAILHESTAAPATAAPSTTVSTAAARLMWNGLLWR